MTDRRRLGSLRAVDRAVLSRRELDVLMLLDAGVNAKAAAVRLGLSEATVRSYIRSALRKLGCHSQLEATARARRLGLLGGGATGAGTVSRAASLRAEGGYRLLADILASCLGHSEGDGHRPEQAGEAWGRYLVDRPPLSPPLPPEEALRELIVLLESVGFEPERRENGEGGLRLLLHACPFREVATTHRRVVCGVHRGVIRGALAELGGALTVTELQPFAQGGACAVDLAPAARRRSRD